MKSCCYILAPDIETVFRPYESESGYAASTDLDRLCYIHAQGIRSQHASLSLPISSSTPPFLISSFVMIDSGVQCAACDNDEGRDSVMIETMM